MKALQIFTAVVFSLILFISCSTKSNPVYTLTTSTDPAASGTVMPSQGGFDEGSDVEITAFANENMVFSGWRGDYSGSDNPTVVTMNTDINIIAFFIDRKYPLSILIEGEGTVTERVLNEKSTEFDHEIFVELTANPAEGWKLAEWQGDLSGSENPTVIRMDEAREVTAVFENREYPLSISIKGEGSVAEQVIQEKTTDYEYSSLIELTAHSADGWIFSGWDGDLEGNENPERIIINQPTNVTAIFIPIDELLTLTVHGEGTVDIEQFEPDDNSIAPMIQLTARASDSWRFVEWTGDVTSTENPVQITLNEEKTVNAVFEIRKYPLTINTDGEGTVTEDIIHQKSSDYEDGTVVELTANANQGWKFVEWQGDLSGSENPQQITIDSPKEVTAVFVEEPGDITFNLAINIEGEGSVNIDPELDEYNPETIVELLASPFDNWKFVEWTGDINSVQTSVELTMDSDKEITAIFAEEKPDESTFELDVNIDGEGSVNINPDQDDYESGTIVQLTASPSDGWRFVRWRGDINSFQTTIEITLDSDREVTAVFAEESEEVTFNLIINTQGEGSVSIEPEQDEYKDGTMVELTASPTNGWEFVEWTGDINSSQTSVELIMDSNKEVTAIFIEETEEIAFELNLNIQGEGSLSINPEQDEYVDGTMVELTASPTDGWEFVEWTGDINSSQTSVELIMDSDKKVAAVFEEVMFDLTINITGNGTVNINPDLDEFEPGTLVELTAVPSDGWEFDQWEGDLTGSENPTSITMVNSAVITVLFTERETVFSGGDGSSGNPYQVSTSEQLQTIGEFVDSHFIQVSNINAGSTSGWNGSQGFSPIGSSSNPFTGTFNGNEFEISGLTIDRDGDDYIGLFGFTGNAQINNVRLVNVNIIGEDIVGGLAGTNNGQIRNSYVTGFVSGDEMVGGLVGINNGQITNSYSEASVVGDDDHIGGLVGINGSNGEITNSFASGNVEADDAETGGLVGTNNGEISNSYSTGNVTGDESVGGLVGGNRNNARIVNSYATGSVSGDDEVGGLVGRNWPNGVIETSFASGTVSGDDETGGFIGWNQASLDSCYWDNQSTNQGSGVGRGNQNGLTGLTTSEMTGSSAEENMSGFNWNSIWRTSANYPVLQWQD